MKDLMWQTSIEPIFSSDQAEKKIRMKALRSKISTIALSAVAGVASYYSLKYSSQAIHEAFAYQDHEVVLGKHDPLSDFLVGGISMAFGVISSSIMAYAERKHTNQEISAIVASHNRFKGIGSQAVANISDVHSDSLNTKVEPMNCTFMDNPNALAPSIASTTPLAIAAFETAPNISALAATGFATAVAIGTIGFVANSVNQTASTAIEAINSN